MKIYFALYYSDELICASDKLSDITYYLHQKSTIFSDENYKIKRFYKIFDIPDEYLLIHYEGYLITKLEYIKDVEFKMKQKEKYFNTLEILKYLSDYSDDQKEIKKINKVIDIVKSYEHLFNSLDIKDMAKISVKDLSDQYELDKLFITSLEED